jgi:putative ABC transport system substrate-binding protein
MNKKTWIRWPDSSSDNRKSKIQNLKWCGIVAFALTFAMCGAVAEAQQPGKVPRIGFLSVSPPIDPAFLEGLRELGYVDRKNIVIEYRSADGKLERLPKLAADLVNLKVDVVVTRGTPAASASKQATQTIPIVMAISGGDLVKLGLVTSFSRPGGNVTGLTLQVPELSGKRLELLKEAAPKTTSVAVIWNASSPANTGFLRETEAAARLLGLQLQSIEVRSPADLDGAFKAVARARADALITLADGMLFDNRARIAQFAAKSQIPAMFPDRGFAEAGGLMVYGPDLAWTSRRAAWYVDRILKGAKPADLPVEQPTKFELLINLKAAKQIGLTIPPNVLARADRVIK